MKYFLQFGHFIVILLILLLVFIAVYRFDYLAPKTYKASDFGIKTLKSKIDKDKDGIDDYKDILMGARKFISKNPKYKLKYYESGYPNDEYRTNTDILWYSLKNAGYNFKKMIDADIKKNSEEYNIGEIDSNMDFRRLKNIRVFLDKYTKKITIDSEEIEKWQPGDIVIYEDDLAIISDKRNKEGIPYIIHHNNRIKYEENTLSKNEIVGHYRFILTNN